MARALILLALIAMPAVAAAQALADPTRPPHQFTNPDAVVNDSSGGPLQSILISGERKAAVINGRVVPLGGAYGKSRVVSITPTEVVLKGDESSFEVLKIYPRVEKTESVRLRNQGTRGAAQAEVRE